MQIRPPGKFCYDAEKTLVSLISRGMLRLRCCIERGTKQRLSRGLGRGKHGCIFCWVDHFQLKIHCEGLRFSLLKLVYVLKQVESCIYIVSVYSCTVNQSTVVIFYSKYFNYVQMKNYFCRVLLLFYSIE